jgi:hypothetical protein
VSPQPTSATETPKSQECSAATGGMMAHMPKLTRTQIVVIIVCILFVVWLQSEGFGGA